MGVAQRLQCGRGSADLDLANADPVVAVARRRG